MNREISKFFNDRNRNVNLKHSTRLDKIKAVNQNFRNICLIELSMLDIEEFMEVIGCCKSFLGGKLENYQKMLAATISFTEKTFGKTSGSEAWI